MSKRRIRLSERDGAVDKILQRLTDGESMSVICAGAGMPDRATVRRWSDADPALAERIREAREIGYHERAERAVQAAKEATDAQLGRLAFDAERWYLGKLSNAFAERPARIESQTNVQVNVDAGSAFGRIVDLMDRAAAGIAGRAGSTKLVAHVREAGPGGAAGGLDDMADPGGSRLGQDEDGG